MQKLDMHKMRDVIEACLLLVCLVGSGAGIGYWAGTERTRYMLVDERKDRLEEIERMQSTYRESIAALTGRLNNAAITVGNAAEAVQSAADTAKTAATTVAKTAARVSARPAPVEVLPDAERRSLNSAIGRGGQ
jgi:hypothetical protein